MTTEKTTIDILRDAKALLERPNGWTQGCCARNAKGVPTNLEFDEAVCFCAMGALWRAGGFLNPITDKAAAALTRAAFPGLNPRDVAFGPAFNDRKGRTLPEVLAKFDEAIAAEEAKLGLEVPA